MTRGREGKREFGRGGRSKQEPLTRGNEISAGSKWQKKMDY